MGLFISADSNYLAILPGLLAVGLGMGLAMTPSTEVITSSLPADKQGVASALNDITREFGTALGVALLGALLSAGYRDSINSRLVGVPQEAADTAREGLANAAEVSRGAGAHAEQIIQAARESFVDGWQQTMWVGAAVMLALFIYIVVRGPKASATGTVDATEAVTAPATVGI
ncbi:hypothetical protein [Promicromonospora sp. NPDC023987]|uniref:hypothetical protein n=1 Tax=Promicromonospora sp. NPDC023987 TaxID=3155360 RepID=UPI0033EDEB00